MGKNKSTVGVDRKNIAQAVDGPGPLNTAMVRLTLWSPLATMAARCTNAGSEVAPVSLPPVARRDLPAGRMDWSEVGGTLW